MIYKLFPMLFVSFFVSVILTKLFLPVLHRLKFGQQVREDGPGSHLKKQGTPTMGGVVILASFTLCTLVFARESLTSVIPVFILVIGFGLVGFLDDFIKIGMKRSMGLNALQKLVLQFLVTGVFYFYITKTIPGIDSILIPFTGLTWNMGGLFLPFVFVAVLGTVNGANFTDGVDGLASSVTIIILAFFGTIGLLMGKGEGAVSVFYPSVIMIGVLLGFLVFNIYPAKLFMGDTGSLALGGIVAAAAILTKTPLFILIVAFIYLAEILSVVLQVGYFKLTKGKRLFKMAPIHHHFELCGMEETRVVYLFSVITLFLCMLGYTAL